MTDLNHAAAWAGPLRARRRPAPVLSARGIAQPVADSGGCPPWLMAAAEAAGIGRGLGPPDVGSARLVSTQTHDTDARGIRRGREFTVATLRRWGVTERCEETAVVVSELLTNALRHAVPGLSQTRHGWPVRLGLMRAGPYVLCAVADPSSSVPVVKRPERLAEGGRGLHVVGALSDKWGYSAYSTPSDMGKAVWAMFLVLPSTRLPQNASPAP